MTALSEIRRRCAIETDNTRAERDPPRNPLVQQPVKRVDVLGTRR